ncbi:MAG: S-layer homology domain-containing protein [Oscillospiraceae bacterium]|nr:S-layer homology domain-containing protein [Oscillospiraceae bacterium]
MKKRLLHGLLSAALAVLLCVSLMIPALAAAPVVYNGDALYPGRTRAEIGQHYAQALAAGGSYQNSSTESWYSAMPSLESPYAEGVLTTDTHAAMTAMTNYYRWLVGASALREPSVHSTALQKAALVRNWDFNHSVDSSRKPEDMDQTLWDEGAGVWHNILAWGYTPRGAINGWLNEGYSLRSGSWDTIGHRTALLTSRYSSVQFGYSGRIAIGVIEKYENTMTQPFAAFPAAGDMPLTDVSALDSAWSVELNTGVIRSTSAAEVRVTNTATGESYTCTAENGKLHTGSTLSFVQPTPKDNASRYADGDAFRVEITGLTDVASGGEAKIDYTVRFFDVRNYTPTTVSGFTFDGWSRLRMTSRYTDDASLQKIASILPDTVNVQTEVGRVVRLPVSGAWRVDAANKRWINSADASRLPQDVTDPGGVLQTISVPWQVDDYTGSLGAVNGSGKAGESGSIRMWRYNISYPWAEVYQVKPGAAGGWDGKLRFDNDSASFSIDDSGYYVFAVDSWANADSGDWIGIYYNKSGSWTDAWLAGIATVSIQCDHPSVTTQTTAPTCTEPGQKTTVCAVCGETVGTETIPATGHDWDAWVVTTKPTCTEAGEEKRVCKHDPAHTETRAVAALGHEWSEWTVTRPATETAEGEESRICARCLETETRPIGVLTPPNPFSDVVKGAYYFDPVLWAVNHDPQITKGTSDTTFSPDATCTRGQVVTFLWRAMGEPEPSTTVNKFVDVQTEDYFYKAVLWAVEKGITVGTSDTTFSPNDPCTRAHVVTFLWRAEGQPEASGTNPFADVDNGQYYYSAVLWAVSKNITQGTSASTFSPDDPCTRAQIVTFLYRDMK